MQRHVAQRTDWMRKLREVLVGSKDWIMASQYLNSVAHSKKKKVVKSVKY